MEHLAQKVEQLENMLLGLIDELFGGCSVVDHEDSMSSGEGEEHPGESCEEAHSDMPHEERAQKQQRGEN